MQSNERKQLKSLLCQLGPRLKEKTANLERVRVSLQHYSQKDKLDIILFPEMSFVGYNFKDEADAMDLACEAGSGEEFAFISAEAKRLNCYIIYGYIEKEEKEGTVSLYNSATLVGRDGKMEINVRKTHLFFNDKLWCKEGDGFKSVEIANLKGQKFKCAIGICMDINPKDFTSGEWELADFCQKQGAEVLLFITNWVDSSAQSVEDKDVLAMYNYWMHRMHPLLGKEKRSFLFLAADRVGTQYSYFDKKDTHFFGSSCAIMLNPNYIIQRLGKKQEGYLVAETSLPK